LYVSITCILGSNTLCTATIAFLANLKFLRRISIGEDRQRVGARKDREKTFCTGDGSKSAQIVKKVILPTITSILRLAVFVEHRLVTEGQTATADDEIMFQTSTCTVVGSHLAGTVDARVVGDECVKRMDALRSRYAGFVDDVGYANAVLNL